MLSRSRRQHRKVNLKLPTLAPCPASCACVFPMTLAFQWLKAPWRMDSTVNAAAVVVCQALAFWASYGLKDTFDADLDYVEK